MEPSSFTVFLSRYYRFPKLFPHLAASLKGMASSSECFTGIFYHFPGNFIWIIQEMAL